MIIIGGWHGRPNDKINLMAIHRCDSAIDSLSGHLCDLSLHDVHMFSLMPQGFLGLSGFPPSLKINNLLCCKIE